MLRHCIFLREKNKALGRNEKKEIIINFMQGQENTQVQPIKEDEPQQSKGEPSMLEKKKSLANKRNNKFYKKIPRNIESYQMLQYQIDH